jgi:hypothetical protein
MWPAQSVPDTGSAMMYIISNLLHVLLDRFLIIFAYVELVHESARWRMIDNQFREESDRFCLFISHLLAA